MEIGAEQVQEDQIEQSFEETPPGKPLLGDEDPNVEVCDEHIPSETKKAKMSFADRVGLCLSWFRRAFESTTLNEWARHITLAACIILVPCGAACTGAYEEDLALPVGIYSMVIGVLLFPLFWPVIFENDMLRKPILITQNYLLMGVSLMLLSIFPYFMFPTHLGAITMTFAAIIYLLSALKDEKPKNIDQIIRIAQGGRRPKKKKENKK